jgi:AraC-like DNA-binding protein
MPGSGTHTFLEPDHYEAHLRRAQIELTITCGAGFNARLTCAELHHLRLLRCAEAFPRISYVSFPSQLACISLPANSDPLPKWRGAEMQAGDIVLHSLGDRLHQTTQGRSIWSLIMLDPAELDHYSRTLFEKPFSLPPEGRVLRPSKRDAARLRRLHAQACRLAETKPKLLAHPEVARAIDEDLIHALVTCLTGARVRDVETGKRRHARIMVRFEEVLREHLDRPLHLPELCELIGVTDRTLRSCCAQFLGIRPSRYVLLRRLKQVRTRLRGADPNMVNISELARRYGFTQLGRFAGAYCAVFGESPSTLCGAPRTGGSLLSKFSKTA